MVVIYYLYTFKYSPTINNICLFTDAVFVCLTTSSCFQRTPSTTSDEFHFPGSSHSLELDPLELSSSSSSSLPRLQPQRSKTKGKCLNPFSSSSTNFKGSESNNQISKSLLQLAKNKSKDGKEKKKKKSKGGSAQTAGRQ